MFKLRNLVGAALVVGIAAGVWLGEFWKGFGWGGGSGLGPGDSLLVTTQPTHSTTPPTEDDARDSPPASRQTVRVVIRDRSYYLKQSREEQPIALQDLVALVQQAQGDEDGIRLRVYRAESSRATAELQLQEALRAVDIPESAIYWSPEVAH